MPLVWLRLLWRARRQPEYLQQLGERHGFYAARPAMPLIWLHAVSVGETRAAEPLIESLLRQYPTHSLLLTHMTPTGHVLTYTSDATDIVPGDVNGRRDIFAVVLSSDIGVLHCVNQPNSTGQRGLLRATGSVLVVDNDVTLHAEQLPNQVFGFFITSLNGTPPPAPTGPMICMSGAVGRYIGPGQVQNTGILGGFSLALDLTQIPTPTGFVSALSGETRYFQCWHRDIVQGQPRSNFTDALAITFQ